MDMQVKNVVIPPLKMEVAEFTIVGTAPYVQNRFSAEAAAVIAAAQAAGNPARNVKKRTPKDFKALYENAQYHAVEGWAGQPASAYRKAMISACRVAQFKMTLAKLSVFILPDGFDAKEGMPLVRIIKGKPRRVEHMVRNATGVCDVRVRAMFDEWKIKLRVEYDSDQFTSVDIANLVVRCGRQVGIGEGRPDSRESAGMGWGTFTVAGGE